MDNQHACLVTACQAHQTVPAAAPRCTHDVLCCLLVEAVAVVHVVLAPAGQKLLRGVQQLLAVVAPGLGPALLTEQLVDNQVAPVWT